MTYTNAWTNTVPLGSELAANIDDFMRRDRLDIFERMNDLVVDWTADPVVLKPSVIANITGTKILIPHCAFLSDLHAKENDLDDLAVYGFVGSPKLYAPVIVPNGVLITQLEYNIDLDAASSVSAKFFFNDFTNPPVNTSTSVLTLTTSTGTLQTLDSGVLAGGSRITTDTDKMYFIEISATGTAGHSYKVFGARITYEYP